jgi:glycosyltransferase involved in cell wall biosynthesis
MNVSVVVTVLNEATSLPKLLSSLARQTRPPDEVVFCDGGSHDGSLAMLRSFNLLPVHIIESPGVNISRGRNIAIAAAGGDVIAVTDAGVRLSPNWLQNITEPFAVPETQVVSGFFLPDPQSTFETAMGATVLPDSHEIDPDRFLPSSRSVAFRRSAWEAVGGYPEWLDYCEDLIFDMRLRDTYGRFVFRPDAQVYFRPRSSLSEFFKQYYLYARGDGKSGLWPMRHTVRYLTYLVAVPAICLAGMRVNPYLWILYGAAVPGMFWRPWRRLTRLWTDLGPMQRLLAACWIPLIRVVGDIAKMVGYPVGLCWRFRHRREDLG